MTASTAPTVEDYRARLERAARQVEDARDYLETSTHQRDSLIVSAVDQGLPQRQVAEAANIARSRVTAILAAYGFTELI